MAALSLSLSHFSSCVSLSSRNRSFLDLLQTQYQQQKLHWYGHHQHQPHNSGRRESSIYAGSVRKSRVSKKAKSDVELCYDIREFIKSVGLPEDHVPSTKELSQHGRSDLANIVRRRGHKLLRELLTNSTKTLENDGDAENITLAGADGEPKDVVEDLSSSNEVLIAEKFSPSLSTNHATCSDDCNSTPTTTANLSVEEELSYDSEVHKENNESYKENDENIDKVEENISLKTEVTAAESYFSSSKIGLDAKCNDYNGEPVEFSPKLHSVEKSVYSLEYQSEAINNMVDESSLSPEVLFGETYLGSSSAGEDLNMGGLDDKPMLLATGSSSKEEALCTNEQGEKEDKNVDDISMLKETSIMDDHSNDLDFDQGLVHDESSYKLINSSEKSYLEEKVAKFIQSGDLDMIDARMVVEKAMDSLEHGIRRKLK